ncbi:MAG: putative maltokinase, partial [Candidatus Methylomirabilales bacterium]
MQWSADRNAGFSQANPQKLYLPTIIDPEYHAGAINVEAQQQNSQSLLWWMKRLVALRKRYKAFGRGSLEMLYPENRKILAFVRSYGEERILVVANLSRLAQYVELDLSSFRGAVPIELFGGTDFPPVSDRPYFLTLGPHTFYWFALQPGRAEARAGRVAAPPLLKVAGDWREIFSKKNREALEELLPSFLVTRRWFGGKARRIRSVEIVELVPVAVPNGAPSGYLTLLRVEYTDGDPDLYLLPLAATSARRSREEEALAPAAVARLSTKDGDQLLYDAVWDPDFCSALLEALAGRRRLAGISGKVTATPTRAFRPIRGQGPLAPYVMQAEQSNSSIGYGDRLLLKLFRRLGEGENPDLEIGRFLTERTVFPHIPPVAGALEYRRGRGEPVTLGILHGFAPNQGDAWSYTLDSLGRFAERVLVGRPESEELTRDHRPHLLDMAAMQPSPAARELIGEYLESARLIGERTGGLHTALASEPDHPSFAPEPFTPFYQRSTYESMRALTLRTFRLLRERTDRHPEAVQVLDLEAAILKRFRALLETRITATRIRCHGDYHLGQVLFTGRDFLIIDFEGEPARSLGERRIKRSPIRDVAGMIRSFHYAAFALLYGHAGAIVRPDDPSILEPWLHFWYRWVSASFLRAYLHAAAGASFLPPARGELEVLLDAFLLEKALYELAYELDHRPDWAGIPLRGVRAIIN